MGNLEKDSFIWIDGKLHNVAINDGNEDIDVTQLKEFYKKQLEAKEDTCKNIYYLGVKLTGSPEVSIGFLIGWLIRSLKESAEKKSGNKWNITHSTTDLSTEEMKNHIVGSLKQLAESIEKDDDYKPDKKPLLRGDVDGTEFF